MSVYTDRVFAEAGLLADHFRSYEPRPQQIQLAEAVDHAFSHQDHLLAEGPTGVGKTLATLVPATYHAANCGKKVVVATATIVLQEQVVEKDLPLLQKVLPWDFTFALLKGRSNYLCRDRYDEAADQGFDRLDVDPDQLATVQAWADTTTTGNKAELDFEPPDALWSRICGHGDECDSGRCEESGCFTAQARRAAHAADIIVCNYSLLFSHLAVKSEIHQNIILPDFDLIICDEGHEMADIAREWFGFRVTEFAVRRLARALINADNHALAHEIREAAVEFFGGLRAYHESDRYKARIRERDCVDSTRVITALDQHRAFWASKMPMATSDAEERRFFRRVILSDSLATRITAVMDIEDENAVYWIDRDDKDRIAIASKPIDVSGYLRNRLFSKVDSAVVTSATLATAGQSFDYIRGQIGIRGGKELVVPSAFDFRRQALFVVPPMAAAVNDASFQGEMAIETKRVLDMLGGRTLGLFTSWKNLHAVHERLTGNGHRVLLQGEAPRSHLIRAFQTDEASVLLGTASFWTGIDVPGPALTCVVIDKLPFPSPDDPIMDALAERDKNWFMRHFIPRAVIKIRQGFGRLIRTRDDVGVVILFDNRILTKSYGAIFRRSLPDCRTSRTLDSIPVFLGLAGVEGGQAA